MLGHRTGVAHPYFSKPSSGHTRGLELCGWCLESPELLKRPQWIPKWQWHFSFWTQSPFYTTGRFRNTLALNPNSGDLRGDPIFNTWQWHLLYELLIWSVNLKKSKIVFFQNQKVLFSSKEEKWVYQRKEYFFIIMKTFLSFHRFIVLDNCQLLPGDLLLMNSMNIESYFPVGFLLPLCSLFSASRLMAGLMTVMWCFLIISLPYASFMWVIHSNLGL